MFVVQNYLRYILIRLPQCKELNLNVDCLNNIITQNNEIISLMTNNIDNVPPKTLHVSSEFHVNMCNKGINVTQNVQSENDIFF